MSDDFTPPPELVQALTRTVNAVSELDDRDLAVIDQVFREFAYSEVVDDTAAQTFRALERALLRTAAGKKPAPDAALLVALLAFPGTGLGLPDGVVVDDLETAESRTNELRALYGRLASDLIQIQEEGPLDWTRATITPLELQVSPGLITRRIQIRIRLVDRSIVELVMTPDSYGRFLARLADAVEEFSEGHLTEIDAEVRESLSDAFDAALSELPLPPSRGSE